MSLTGIATGSSGDDDEIELAAWRLAVDRQPSEELPDIAAGALARGVDSPALRELAGLARQDVREAADLFRRALSELDLDVSDPQEALWRLVYRTARQIVTGEISPGAGAFWIWREAAHRVDEEGDLRIFVGLASELEDHPEARAGIEARIRDEARALLARPGPRRWIRLQAVSGQPALTRQGPAGARPIVLSHLPVGQAVKDDLTRWVADYEKTVGGDVPGFPGQHDAEEFIARGRNLVDRLQSELGQDWQVEYWPEPIRPPGLRLRAPNPG